MISGRDRIGDSGKNPARQGRQEREKFNLNPPKESEIAASRFCKDLMIS